MKRLNNIYDEFVSLNNLKIAFYKSQKRKTHRDYVIKYRNNLIDNLLKLQKSLINKNYDLGHYRDFYVYEPKKRLISTVPFRERIIHHAIMNIVEDRFESYMIDHSYACRIGKGIYKAIKYAQKCTFNYKYYLKLDVHHYFESINHENLYKLCEHLIADKRFLHLLKSLIESYGDKKGIPIGNLTSQYFGNLYLSQLDHYIMEILGIHGYCRYMDDFVCFFDDKKELKEKFKLIKNYITDKLLLELNEEQINNCNFGIPFLGYRVFCDNIRLSLKSKRRFAKKIKKSYYLLESGIWNQEDFQNHITPLVEFVKKSNGNDFINKYIKYDNDL